MQLTQDWLGTPAYTAPEQFSRSGDPRLWDVWGLGATLFELITLRFPYDRSTAAAQTSDPEPPRSLDRSIPRDRSAKFLPRMFAEDLRRWQRLEPTTARPARALRRSWLWTRRNKGWAATILIFVLATLAVGTTLIYTAQARALGREREIYLMQLQQLRLGTHQAGWFKEADAKAWKIAKIRKDDDLRDQYANTCRGMDARITKTIKRDAAALAFDAKGQRLLLGGTSKYLAQPVRQGQIWD